MDTLRVGRNAPCPCGSGKKHKVCCLRRHTADQVFRPPATVQPQPVFSDGASTRPKPQPRLASSNGDDRPIKRIPVHYTYPEPFGHAECVYCFPVDRLIILVNGSVVLAEWLQPGMQFRMEDGQFGNVTAVEPSKVWEPPSRVPDQYGRYARRVLGTIKHKGFVLIDITFGGQTVSGTPDHRWYSASRKAWVPAQTLRPGELLLNGQGSVVAVESVSEPRYGFMELYNLEVEELHTYFVGSSEHGSALVHNGEGNYIQQPATPAARPSPPASTPVGSSRAPFNTAGPNAPTTINGRPYAGHAIDQMQARGIPPSVVENTIQHGGPGRPQLPTRGTTSFYDPVNNVTVITDTATGRVVTTFNGR
ncbi:MAG: SEC-C domain-containing protein [Gemmataceae bacterium]|nr:SEC-C domain-containing protein [Gemmataceae bacterium]